MFVLFVYLFLFLFLFFCFGFFFFFQRGLIEVGLRKMTEKVKVLTFVRGSGQIFFPFEGFSVGLLEVTENVRVLYVGLKKKKKKRKQRVYPVWQTAPTPPLCNYVPYVNMKRTSRSQVSSPTQLELK